MSWNYLRNEGWESAEIKYRDDGAWAAVGDSDDGDDGGGGGGGGGGIGDVPERFYTDGPPDRSGSTITYPADGHSSLQDAVDSLSSGDTLYVEPGTYQERIYFDGSQADHITIESDLRMEYDENGEPTVTQEGAVLEMPDSSPSYALGCSSMWFSSDAELAATYPDVDDFRENATQDTIEVTDASPFEPGDAIYIREATRPYGMPDAGGARNADKTIEFRTVEEVDESSDALTLDVPIFMPYPGENETDVGVLDFNIQDLCVRGITFRGTGPGSNVEDYPVDLNGIEDGWFEHVRVQDGGENPLLRNQRCYNMRFDRMRYENSYHYGMQTRACSTRVLVTNVSADDIGRYCTMFGAGTHMSSDAHVVGVHGTNFKMRSVVDVHSGAFHVDFEDVYSEGAATMTPRSRHLRVDGFEVTGDGADGTSDSVILRQRPYNVEIRDGYVHDRTTTAEIFSIGLRDESDSAFGNEWFDRIVIEDVEIEDYGVDITDIGEFRGTLEGDSLTLRNITCGGQQLDRSHVEQWDGYDDVTITDLTVE